MERRCTHFTGVLIDGFHCTSVLDLSVSISITVLAAVLVSITTNLNRGLSCWKGKSSLGGCYVKGTTNITTLLTTVCLCKCTVLFC